VEEDTLTLTLTLTQFLPLWGAASFENMNGEYLTTPTPNAKEGQFSTEWNKYPNGGVEFFEV